MQKRKIKKRYIPASETLTEFDLRVLDFQSQGFLVPTRQLIKTPEQIEGIRRSGKVNTGVLDLIAQEIRAGMSTAEIDRLVYDYTTSHGAIPAPLNYEGFPKSVCTSINEVVCHGIPSEDEILEEGDIINVDVSTILDGYYNGFSVVRDLCGHGVGLEFHEEPEVEHYDTRHKGMLLVPGMVFTIEPMINMGTWEVFVDEEDGWTVVSEDELPSAQWEHTFLMTEDGVEVLTY